jgi:hypothetical protein
MEQSPSWEANRFVASQEILRILWNPKVHYRIHNWPPLVSILSQPNPAHTPTSHFLKTDPNILLSTPGSPQWPISLRFSHQNPIHASLLPHPRYVPRPHSSWFYHPHNIGWGVQNMKLLIMKFSPLLTVCTTCFKITKTTFYPLIVCVCCNFDNKRPLFSCTALIGSLSWKRSLFSVSYEFSCIVEVSFTREELNQECI